MCVCVSVCVTVCVHVCVCVCVAGTVFKFDVCIIYDHHLSKNQLLIFWLKLHAEMCNVRLYFQFHNQLIGNYSVV